MSTQICNPCAGAQVCLDSPDRYSLQDDQFFYVLNCPPGVFCGGNNVMYITCCDGVIEQQVFPAGSTSAQRNALISELISRCLRKQAFCDGGDGDGTVPGDDTDGGGGSGGAGGGTDPNNPVQLYANNPQGYTTYCPDRLPFTYEVPAGVIWGFTQAAADAAARNYARTQALAFRICLSGPSRVCCIGTAYTSKIQASNGRGNMRWTILNGSLPPGLTATPMGQHALRISGIPTTGGVYTFSVRATDAYGAYMTKPTSITVWGIIDSTLPNATEDSPYSHSLSVVGGTSPYLFNIASGTFPTGMDMDGSGVISGTPTESGTFTVLVRVRDSST